MNPTVELKGVGFRLRPWRLKDALSVAKYANNRAIWINLDRFPHPYALEDAREWLNMVTGDGPERAFAIEIGDEAVGAISVTPKDDVQVKVGEIGYWLGEPFWGRGIATAAVKLVTEYAFEDLDLMRIQASVFEWNPASGRVLEKAGYQLEGRLRKSIFKDGKVIDSLIYARVRHQS